MTSNCPIHIAPIANRFRVLWKGRALADTTRSLMLYEVSYPGVRYIPRNDASTSFLRRTTHKTRCPYKGEALYYSIVADDGEAINAVWTYEAPLPVATGIAGYLAFDPRVVEFVEG